MLTHPLLAENSLFKLIGEIFHPLFELFGLILAGLYAVWPNYGFAIAGLTILIMLALTPVTVKSTKSMLAMQRLQPEMKKLQAKYKGPENREMLNQEMMRLYKENGTSPFGACLPSLLQMPFLIVLYTLIRGLSTTTTKVINGHKVVVGAPRYIPTNSHMYHDLVLSQGQMHWWFGMDLSAYPLSNHTTDPFTHAVITSMSQWVLTIPYLVLIAGAMFLQYYQMKQMNSRNPQAAAANPQMQTMQKFFPIIFGVIYLKVPAGATIYMVVSSAMRIGTQEVMFRTGMVAPVVHEREIGSAKGTRTNRRSQPRSRCRRRPRARRTARRPPRRPCRRPRAGATGAPATEGSRPQGRRRTAVPRPTARRRPRSRTRGRARSGTERLDSAWSGWKWRERRSRTPRSVRSTSSGSPWATPRSSWSASPRRGSSAGCGWRPGYGPAFARSVPARAVSGPDGAASRARAADRAGASGPVRAEDRRAVRPLRRRRRTDRARRASGRRERAPGRAARRGAGATGASRRPVAAGREKTRGTDRRQGRPPRGLRSGAQNRRRRQRTWPRE